MKKYLLIIVSIVFILDMFAQKTMNIFLSGLSVENIAVSSIDSMKLSSDGASLYIFKTDKSTNSIVVATIDSITFSDTVLQNLPLLSTNAASSVSYNTALSGLNILSIGGTSIVENGLCWSTNQMPTIGDSKIVSTEGTSSSALSITGLPAGTMIYARAYATNISGTGYGNQISFTTLNYNLPAVETISATYDYSTNKVTCVGKVSSSGGCSVTERGVCWSTSKTPTVNDFKYASGISVGQYYGFMNDLSINSTYYVRSYATNCIGTAYGSAIKVQPLMGNVTFTMGFDSTSYPKQYRMIKVAMDSACYYYNRYTPFRNNIWINYDAGVPTAQANYHGSISFGAGEQYMWVGTAMHEMAHYFGSGTNRKWQNLMVDGFWKGPIANALCMQLTGKPLEGGSVHYWPTGINYRTEVNSKTDLIHHAKIAKAMIVDDAKLPISW